ncbi:MULTISPECIES: dihydrofolate reductase [unclassified Clostridium]|jgi:dihydrofolate reductase|uniref:dihydrofolate reductase n=1 Tax=Clostridium TaxID=1485 RepID=UPI001C8C862D|nr:MULTISPECIES: dihydrofolate reductase [unclassified Clostridium]MBX9138728.1 dihydrofolate reductase [Clostridium sp. K12(2020)]MBX9145481.1 dihydrofolate reductase [Clostridium sp. K13]MDU2291816.1 dihydrofolate reductase [Clostridium celatum]MDU4324680.1 dihydrofolate reductase [Clostridium celatum]
MLSIIVAIAENNIIGGDNKLLWHIPEDLKRFKAITSGNTIIMGRKTFESLPGVLPNRKHVIITRDENYSVDNENVEVIHSLSEVINKYKNSSEPAFIIGGGEIYKQLIHNVDNLLLTKVFKSFDGDTSFPQIDLNEFAVDFESEILTCEKNGLQYQFIDLVRK